MRRILFARALSIVGLALVVALAFGGPAIAQTLAAPDPAAFMADPFMQFLAAHQFGVVVPYIGVAVALATVIEKWWPLPPKAGSPFAAIWMALSFIANLGRPNALTAGLAAIAPELLAVQKAVASALAAGHSPDALEAAVTVASTPVPAAGLQVDKQAGFARGQMPMVAFATIGMVMMLALQGCVHDTAQAIATLDASYSAAAPAVVAGIESGKLTATEVTGVKSWSQDVHDGLSAASSQLAACPRVGAVIDASCANSSAISGALAIAKDAWAKIVVLFAGKGIVLPSG